MTNSTKSEHVTLSPHVTFQSRALLESLDESLPAMYFKLHP